MQSSKPAWTNKRAAAQHITWMEGWGAHPGRVWRTVLWTRRPYHRDICAPSPCVLLSLGSCPEHLCPSHLRDGHCPPGPALRQAINIPPNLPSSLKPLAPWRWPRQPMEQPTALRPVWGHHLLPPRSGMSVDAESPRGDGTSRQALPETLAD